jgi:serine/threonine protein phosphatase PrpC
MDAEPAVAIGVASDQGRQRTENQDSLATPPPDLSPEELSQKGVLCLVADGIGGHRAGKPASDLVARRVMEEYYGHPPGDVPGALRRAIRIANADLYRLAQEPGYEKMGTTIVAAVLHGETLTVAHVGDSRAYLLSQDRVHALTRDHTWVTEQLDDGVLTQEQADRHIQRHVLTRSLGSHPKVLIDVIHTSLRPGDQVLLCSDGLWETVSLAEIEAAARGSSPQQAARRLVELANEHGGPDNITVVLARPDLGPGSPASPLPSTGLAERLGATLSRFLSGERGKRWPVLAAAALLVILALACTLTILLGGLLPGGEATIPTGSTATLGTAAEPALPHPGVTGLPGPERTTTAAATTQASVQGRVATTLPLSLRPVPRTAGLPLANLNPGISLTVSCRTTGEAVDGNTTWYRVSIEGGLSGYVAARWIELQGVEPHAVPGCPERD